MTGPHYLGPDNARILARIEAVKLNRQQMLDSFLRQWQEEDEGGGSASIQPRLPSIQTLQMRNRTLIEAARPFNRLIADWSQFLTPSYLLSAEEARVGFGDPIAGPIGKPKMGS